MGSHVLRWMMDPPTEEEDKDHYAVNSFALRNMAKVQLWPARYNHPLKSYMLLYLLSSDIALVNFGQVFPHLKPEQEKCDPTAKNTESCPAILLFF